MQAGKQGLPFALSFFGHVRLFGEFFLVFAACLNFASRLWVGWELQLPKTKGGSWNDCSCAVSLSRVASALHFFLVLCWAYQTLSRNGNTKRQKHGTQHLKQQ